MVGWGTERVVEEKEPKVDQWGKDGVAALFLAWIGREEPGINLKVEQAWWLEFGDEGLMSGRDEKVLGSFPSSSP